ncbi:ROK family protein [Demequina sp. NBRC 110057]|uniref:ROK family protein n=1 Tax=Demequina sp. NBRC 110057 TaxID=1570346 RepID=UPI000A001839|nr:ROK family protein [Demequina sp. NBRC 110057]
MTGVSIGVDIGGTKIDAVAVDERLQILHRHRVPVERGPEGVVRSAQAAVEVVTRKCAIDITEAHSVGVGIPGAVSGGVVRHALNLDLTELDLAAALGDAWGRPVQVENDVNAAAVGAWRLVGTDARSVAYLNLGTGLAAGIILDGQLWRGSRGTSGEVGHISVDPLGPADAEGNPGGLETYASGSGIVRQWGDPTADARDVMALAAKGDPRAMEIRERLFLGVAHSIRVLVLAYDVEEVIVGGGLTGLGDVLLDGTAGVLKGWADGSRFLASLELAARTRILEGHRPVAAMGAALLGVAHG